MTKTKKETLKSEVTSPEEKIAEIQKDIIIVEKQSQKMAIVKSEADVKKAVEFLGQLKGRFDRVEQLRKFFVEDPTKHIAKVNKMFREQKEPLTVVIGKVKKAVGDYRMAEEMKARKEEERLQKLRDTKNKKREEKGKAIDLTPVPVIERAETTIKTESGKTVTKKVWKFEIEEYSKLPKDVIEEVLYQANQKGIQEMVIRKMVNTGRREIAGVRIYEDIEVSVSAR